MPRYSHADICFADNNKGLKSTGALFLQPFALGLLFTSALRTNPTEFKETLREKCTIANDPIRGYSEASPTLFNGVYFRVLAHRTEETQPDPVCVHEGLSCNSSNSNLQSNSNLHCFA